MESIKIIHSISIGMIGSSFHCSTHSRTIYSWAPYCNLETHRDSLDRRRSESCPRVDHKLSFFLFYERKKKRKKNSISEGKEE